MKILAFDLAGSTGVAVGPSSGKPVCHTEKLGPPDSTHGQRFVQLLRVTRRLLREHEPDAVVIEQAIAANAPGSQSRVQLAMGYRATVLIACFDVGLKPHEYAVSSIRKHFLGHGRMPGQAAKEAVFGRCCKLGWKVENDNESDAAALWDFARAKLTKTSTLPRGLFDAHQPDT